ncbi:MAG: hypothetical protein IJR99_11895 [Kiritimatiellae bacterium]|nr:hypothetical protein [Kiritimatiellia bacterium]
MIVEDVYEPLARYRDEFRGKFSRLTTQTFQALLEKSGVDEEANAKLASEIHSLENSAKQVQGKKSRVGCLIGCVVFLLLAGAVWLFFGTDLCDEAVVEEVAESLPPSVLSVGLIGLAALLFFWLIPANKRLAKQLLEMQRHIAEKKAEAYRQLEPLNRLYDWDMTAKLIEQTVPRIHFDTFFSQNRLREMYEYFGWDGTYNEDKSVLYSQSGEINGNPFLFGELKTQRWGTKTYTGSKQISWWVTVRGPDGKTRRELRTQVLTASIEKPIPVFGQEKILIYGNDAAPDLVFSRQPSSLSNANENSFITSFKKKQELKKLEKLARDLTDDLPYTMMANREFELLFHATDRNDEVAFRLLFTALAQQQMLLLLKDKSVGYGDDFSFFKRKRINVIFPRHLSDISLNTDPKLFYDYDLKRARANFQTFNEVYFKSVYFALAPLLAIPLYQQTKSVRTIYGETFLHQASYWEHEAIANFRGIQQFRHPACVTDCILKTNVTKRQDGISSVDVTAYGYRGENRTHYESVYGGDGKSHQVPIEWIEYLPVQATSEMMVKEESEGTTLQSFEESKISQAETWQNFFRSLGTAPEQLSYRRAILSWFGK